MKIVIIGSGSIIFSRKVIADMLAFEELDGAKICLVDIDKTRLSYSLKMSESLKEQFDSSVSFEASTDRRKLMNGADFIINMVDTGGLDGIEKDLEIPFKYGLRQTVGDTLGIGGIFRGLRTFPYYDELVADIRRLCPETLLINYSNPMGINMLYLQKTAKDIKSVGICHGTEWTHRSLRFYASMAMLSQGERDKILGDKELRFQHWEGAEGGIPYEETIVRNAGINHMNFFIEFTHKGKDLYPLIQEAAQIPEIVKLDPVRFELFNFIDYFVTETSQHTAEYLPYFMRSESEIERLDIPVKWYLYSKKNKHPKVMRETMRKIDTKAPLVEIPYIQSPEYAAKIIRGVVSNEAFVFNGNVHNKNALIENLPKDACIEVLCVADGNGVTPTSFGKLPPQCAALIRSNINVQLLAVLAGIEGCRERLYQAAMLDPNTASCLTLGNIKKLCDELCGAHSELLPEGLQA
jgi:alpha-galactosidase